MWLRDLERFGAVFVFQHDEFLQKWLGPRFTSPLQQRLVMDIFIGVAAAFLSLILRLDWIKVKR